MSQKKRIMSGMRPTGKLHIGHYMGVLKNWVQLQSDYECYFAVADWHALTTKYDKTEDLKQMYLKSPWIGSLAELTLLHRIFMCNHLCLRRRNFIFI